MGGRAPLSGHASAVSSPIIVAGLIPTIGYSGHPVLHWGAYQGKAKRQLIDPPQRPRRNNQNGEPNVGVTRGNSEDLSAMFRARILAQNNETGLVLPDGKRLSVLFIRSLSRTEQSSVTPALRNLTASGLDV